jgi:hypothetical protein
MRIEGIIRGDVDAPSTFADLQHGATINLAQIAIQDELNELTSDTLLPYEHKATGSIVTVAGTRSYALASDFIRFYGRAMLYDSVANFEMFEYPGGEDKLKLAIFNYKTQQSAPFYFYFEKTTTKQLSFYPVPQAAVTYTYDYEADVSVTNATDTLPFHNEQEAQAFCRLAARRFKYLYQGLNIADIDQDSEHMKAKAVLADMIVGKNPSKSYAPIYR